MKETFGRDSAELGGEDLVDVREHLITVKYYCSKACTEAVCKNVERGKQSSDQNFYL
jgi:hypothetical protein